jgi:hypothetical protein
MNNYFRVIIFSFFVLAGLTSVNAVIDNALWEVQAVIGDAEGSNLTVEVLSVNGFGSLTLVEDYYLNNGFPDWGVNYSPGDNITIVGGNNDSWFIITSVTENGSVYSLYDFYPIYSLGSGYSVANYSSVYSTGQKPSGAIYYGDVYELGVGYSEGLCNSSGGNGTGATFYVAIGEGFYAALVSPGSGYHSGDILHIVCGTTPTPSPEGWEPGWTTLQDNLITYYFGSALMFGVGILLAFFIFLLITGIDVRYAILFSLPLGAGMLLGGAFGNAGWVYNVLLLVVSIVYAYAIMKIFT